MARDDEFVMQCALFDLIAKSPLTRDLPIYAVPNFAGHYGSAQSRLIAGARAKRSGRRKGVPDICVDVARGEHHGLRIELKTPTGRVAPEQRAWAAMLTAQGFRVVVCRSVGEAWTALGSYLGGTDSAPCKKVTNLLPTAEIKRARPFKMPHKRRSRPV
jgi:hypothetical protein